MRLAVVLVVACSSPSPPVQDVVVASAPVIDRFSAKAGHLLVRDAKHPLPQPGEPIDFDKPPFKTQGLGPEGSIVRYYHFDVQSPDPATIYLLERDGKPLAGELGIVDVIPGDAGYSDFFRITWVDVPPTVAPGALTSAAQLARFPTRVAPQIIDCPIVPRGSTATEGTNVAPPKPREVWYRGHKLLCLEIGEPLDHDSGKVPTSPIYVTFASEGFQTETGTRQTHNVVMSLPGDVDYSPLWDVHIYDPSAFARVHDAATALAAPLVKKGPLVNCPIVAIEPHR